MTRYGFFKQSDDTRMADDRSFDSLEDVLNLLERDIFYIRIESTDPRDRAVFINSATHVVLAVRELPHE